MSLFYIVFFLVIAGLAVILYLYTPLFSRRYDSRAESPPSSDTHNATNYNMSEMDEEELTGLSSEDAKAIIEKWEEIGHIPAPRDFHRLRQIIKEGEEG